jgi:hypothetical protein
MERQNKIKQTRTKNKPKNQGKGQYFSILPGIVKKVSK